METSAKPWRSWRTRGDCVSSRHNRNLPLGCTFHRSLSDSADNNEFLCSCVGRRLEKRVYLLLVAHAPAADHRLSVTCGNSISREPRTQRSSVALLPHLIDSPIVIVATLNATGSSTAGSRRHRGPVRSRGARRAPAACAPSAGGASTAAAAPRPARPRAPCRLPPTVAVATSPVSPRCRGRWRARCMSLCRRRGRALYPLRHCGLRLGPRIGRHWPQCCGACLLAPAPPPSSVPPLHLIEDVLVLCLRAPLPLVASL